jgi:hypothetical protein
MDTIPHDLRDTLHLAAGAERLLWLPAGTELYACRGRLSIRSGPRALGEIACRSTRLLYGGQCHAVEGAGWVVLAAHDAPAELICVVPAARRAWIDTLARCIARSLRLPSARRHPA